MAPVWAALIALAGTSSACWIGFWQWRRTQRRDHQAAYVAKRREALQLLWDTLRDVEEDQRSAIGTDIETNRQVSIKRTRTINLLLMRVGPFLLEDEKIWASAIDEAISAINAIVQSLPPDAPIPRWWVDTLPSATGTRDVAAAAYQLSLNSKLLGERLAEVLGKPLTRRGRP